MNKKKEKRKKHSWITSLKQAGFYKSQTVPPFRMLRAQCASEINVWVFY